MFYKVLEKTTSSINGEIVIYTIFGSPRMSIGGLLQSGGVIGKIWEKAIKTISNQQLTINNILILGLGCGTAAKLLSKRWPEAKIIGVEIDPIVIDLGERYFDLDKIPNLEIVCGDAMDFVSKYTSEEPLPAFAEASAGRRVTSEVARRQATTPPRWGEQEFDIIIVDLYLGEKIPPRMETLDFLKKLKKITKKGGIIVFNRLFWDEHKRQAEEFVQKAEKVFKNIKLVRTVANLLVICS